jgi:hypothetical protein
VPNMCRKRGKSEHHYLYIPWQSNFSALSNLHPTLHTKSQKSSLFTKIVRVNRLFYSVIKKNCTESFSTTFFAKINQRQSLRCLLPYIPAQKTLWTLCHFSVTSLLLLCHFSVALGMSWSSNFSLSVTAKAERQKCCIAE